MGQFSAEKPVSPGSTLSGNQHLYGANACEAQGLRVRARFSEVELSYGRIARLRDGS
jgi:hypothetical protein